MRIEKYKYIAIIPFFVLLTSILILYSNYINSGDWIKLSFELKGGSLITINNPKIEFSKIEEILSLFRDVRLREMRSITQKQYVIEVGSDINISSIVEKIKEVGIEKDNIAVSTFEPSISSVFWEQTRFAILFAFIAMGIIVFLVFKTFVPSFAVILSAFSDMITTLAIMQVLDIELTLAGLAAILMLIGYSVDTDIMLTTRFLKGKGNINEKFRNALKTGLTMSLTTLTVLIVIYFSSVSIVLSQIASVLLIGLCIDIMNTWIQNAFILIWYMGRKHAS